MPRQLLTVPTAARLEQIRPVKRTPGHCFALRPWPLVWRSMAQYGAAVLCQGPASTPDATPLLELRRSSTHFGALEAFEA